MMSTTCTAGLTLNPLISEFSVHPYSLMCLFLVFLGGFSGMSFNFCVCVCVYVYVTELCLIPLAREVS